MAQTAFERDFHNLNSLVENFLRSYEQLHLNPIRGVADAPLRSPLECVRPTTPQVTTPHAPWRKRVMPKALTPRQPFDDMEAEIVGQLERELPPLVPRLLPDRIAEVEHFGSALSLAVAERTSKALSERTDKVLRIQTTGSVPSSLPSSFLSSPTGAPTVVKMMIPTASLGTSSRSLARTATNGTLASFNLLPRKSSSSSRPQNEVVCKQAEGSTPTKKSMAFTQSFAKLLTREDLQGMHARSFTTYSRKCFEWWKGLTGEDVITGVVEPVMGVAIVLNCIMIGVSLDTEDWDGWPIVDCVFAVLYAFEMCLRLILLGWREVYLGAAWRWSVFDTMIVILAVVDLFVQASSGVFFFRILRLVRLARLLRVLRLPVLRELVMLVRGMAGGTRCLVWCTFFLTLPVFFVGLVLSQLLKDWGEDGLFSSVPASMFTTFRCMCGDCTDNRGAPIFSLVARSRGWHFGFFYSIFTVVTTIGLFNLITALFIEVTMQAAKSDAIMQSQWRKAEDEKYAMNIKRLVYNLWVEHKLRRAESNERKRRHSTRLTEFASFNVHEAMGLEIGEDLYNELVELPHIREILEAMGLTHDDIVNLFEMLDVDQSGTLDMKELVSGVAKLRGEAKKIDLVALSYMIFYVQEEIREINTLVTRLCEAHILPQERDNQAWQQASDPSFKAGR